MQKVNDKQRTNRPREDLRTDFLECWQRLPNKGFFLALLAGWLALFHFQGNSTLGYIRTPSLLLWMYKAYHPSDGWPGDSDDAHGLLVPVVVLGLFWWKRRQLLELPLKTWWPGLLLLSLGLVLHILGYAVQQPRLSIIALFTGIYGLMGLAWGRQWLRASFFPFFLFAFCVPLGSLAQPITFPLRLLVCRLVELVSQSVLATDIIRDGTILRDSTGQYQYEVAAACSGIRSLIATLALAMIYALMSTPKWWKRALLMASAFPLAVIGNVLRMLSIVVAAEVGGQQAGEYIHQGGPGGVLSLLPYLLSFAGLLLLGHWLRERELEGGLPLEAKAT